MQLRFMDVPISKVYRRLRSKNPAGIPYEEAVQLFLAMFCTLDFLPNELRNCVLGRSELVELFSTLELEKFMVDSPPSLNDETHRRECRPRWNELIDNLLTGKIQRQPNFTIIAPNYF